VFGLGLVRELVFRARREVVAVELVTLVAPLVHAEHEFGAGGRGVDERDALVVGGQPFGVAVGFVEAVDLRRAGGVGEVGECVVYGEGEH
jgi:hypothetical protein